MDASQIVLTAEGRQKLVEELAWREGDYAKEIVEDIKEARAFGDLSENSEYDAAKDKQAQNAARIAEIQAILANAQVAATTGDLTVSIGSTVSLIDPNGEVMEVTLVVPPRPTRSSTRFPTSLRSVTPSSVTARATPSRSLRLPARLASTPSPRSHARPRSRVQVCFRSLGPNPGERFSLRS